MNKITVNKIGSVIEIENATYPTAVRHYAVDIAPNIGIDYLYFQWSDATWFESYYVDLNNTLHPFTAEMLTIVSNACINWEQPLGSEGNPTVAQARETKKLELKWKCQEAIEQGFTSSALGTPTLYRCSQTDQSNLQALIIAGINYNFEYVVDDATDTRDVAMHTATQLQGVFNDGLFHVSIQREKKRNLFAQIDALTTVAAVEAIVW